MDKLEELLPGIEEFLTKTLAGEELSENAEKKRQYFSERLDVLKLAFPPTLPPRNEGEDYIAHQRELARLRGPLPPPSEFEDGKDYDPVETRTTVTKVTSTPLATMDDDLLYEEPVDLTDNTNHTTSAPFEDGFSDTSYESYEDEDESGGLYINQDFHDDPNRDLVLPRCPTSPEVIEEKSNKKKKKKVGTPARNLLNVTFTGEMYTKVKWSWSKRYCLIKDGRLMSFKSENATKAVIDFPLDGYDVIYLEKEAKRSHVIRVSRPGCETHFFSADSKDKVDQWVEVLTMGACGGSGGSVTTSGFSSAASSSPKIDKDGDSQLTVFTDNNTTTTATTNNSTTGPRKSSSLTDLSMTSEGSSGDGTIGQPKTTDADKKAQKTDRKGSKPIFDSLSTFFGTLSKKKGEKVQKTKLSDMEENMDPEANVCGYLCVYSELMSSKKWNRRWCVVKASILTVFKDIGEDAEFSLPLPGCEVVSACDPKRKMAMRIMEEGKEKIILDMPDTVAQGQWLNVLIRETGCAEGKTRYPANNGHVTGTEEEEEDIYCDVDDDHDLLESWNLPKEWSLTSDSSTVSDTRTSEKEAEEKPPPLPSAPPPGVTLAKYLKKEQPKQNRASRRTSIKRPTEAPPSVPPPKRDDSTDPKEVVKGHSGRTIEEDMDILASTKNPILTELRRKSRTGPVITKSTSLSTSTLPSTKTKSMTTGKVDAMSPDKLDESLGDTKRKLANIKKKRAEIRSRKLACTDIEEKLRLDDKLRDLLRDQDNAEADLAKLSLKQAELQAQERKARLEQESQARRDSLSRLERQGSFSRVDKKDSLSRFDSGEWDIMMKKTGSTGSEDEGSRKSGASTPRSNGSSPCTGRKANSLDRGSGVKSATLNTKSGVGGGNGSRTRNTRYTSDLTGRTTRTMAVSRTASMSSATRPDSPRGLRLTTRTDEEDRSPSPRGGRKQVQEKLKLWEHMSGTSNC